MESLTTDVNGFISHYTEPFIQSFLAVLLGLFIHFLICRALNRLTNRGYLDYRLRKFLGNILKWIVIAVVSLLILGFFGLSVGTLWAALSGILALVALGFVAVWSVLSNVLCSVLLIIFPPFRIGDYIEVQEPSSDFNVKGIVSNMNMLFTTLETRSEEDVIENIVRIPNNIFFQKYTRVIPGASTESLRKFTARQQDID